MSLVAKFRIASHILRESCWLGLAHLTAHHLPDTRHPTPDTRHQALLLKTALRCTLPPPDQTTRSLAAHLLKEREHPTAPDRPDIRDAQAPRPPGATSRQGGARAMPDSALPPRQPEC